jgi:hypothetical protein
MATCVDARAIDLFGMLLELFGLMQRISSNPVDYLVVNVQIDMNVKPIARRKIVRRKILW